MKIKYPYRKIKTDLIDYLKIEKDSKIIFIGLVKSTIRTVSAITKSITIVEDELEIPSEFKGFNVKNDIKQLNTEEQFADILFCTGTTLINETLEPILERFRKTIRKIVVYGPSSSMLPDIMFDYGVDIVGGMKITNSDAVLKIVQEGGGTKAFKKYGKKYNLIRRS